MKETFDTLLPHCTANNRVCPMPMKWNDMFSMLKETRRVGAGYEPSVPLILGAWGNTSDDQKSERLKEHIRWAADHNQLDEIGKYLRSLPESDWAHTGEI